MLPVQEMHALEKMWRCTLRTVYGPYKPIICNMECSNTPEINCICVRLEYALYVGQCDVHVS